MKILSRKSSYFLYNEVKIFLTFFEVLKKSLKIGWGVGLIIVLFTIAVNLYVLSYSKGMIRDISQEISNFQVGIVFWASVKNNSTPSDILKDRLQVAYEAYKKWYISQIIVSGDNSQQSYNEPVVMQKYLIELWVDEHDIYVDYAGFDTYDTLYRARDIFGVDKALIFTQEFHLKRALYIAARLGIESMWIHTDLQPYIHIDYYNRREVLWRVKAFLDVEVWKSKPKFGWEEIKRISKDDIQNAKNDLLDKAD